ncbi:MAG: DUF6266 family protein [Chitinophagales bacterium]
MGLFSKGILGRFQGLVGTLIGSTLKVKTLMSSRPEPRNNGSFSQKQLEQQAKFALMINFLQQLKSLRNQTFDRTPKSMSGFNKALSYNIVQAIAGNFPAFPIDNSKVQLSQGSCLPLRLRAAPQQLLVNWSLAGQTTAMRSSRTLTWHFSQSKPGYQTMGIRVWSFDTIERGVLVKTRESWEGEPVEAQAKFLLPELDKSIRSWLESLKSMAESMHN